MATVKTLRQSCIFTMLPDLEVLCTTSDISNSFSGRGMFLLEDFLLEDIVLRIPESRVVLTT